jgi:Na+/H+ antiporter NhaC
MPLALETMVSLASEGNLSAAAVAPVTAATVGAVFGGAVFGDHASPFSDTTIVSALACDVTAPAHVATQLPYALLAAFGAMALGYLPFAAGLPAPLAAILLLAGVLAIVLLTRRKFAKPFPPADPTAE